MQRTLYIPAYFSPQGRHADKLALLAHDLMQKTATTNERQQGHFIRYGRDQWTKLFGRNYITIRDTAADQGLIEINHKYSAGRFAKSIRLCPQHRTGQFKTYQPKSAVVKRTLNNRNIKNRNLNIQHDRLGEIGNWLVTLFDHWQLDPLFWNDPSLDWWSRLNAQSICDRSFFATRCEFGRFHSNFTGLKKTLRSCLLTVESFVEIDVANCQPLLLGMICQTTNTNTNTNKIYIPYVLHFFDKTLPKLTLPHDLQDWIWRCENGSIYEFFLDRLRSGEVNIFRARKPNGGSWIEDPRTWDRNTVKKQFLITLFSKSEDTVGNPIFKLFKQHFPTIADCTLKIKRDGHQLVAHLCQRFESKLMIDCVCGDLMMTNPSMPLLTIHDGLLVPKSLNSMVADKILEQFQRFGVTPSITAREYCKSEDPSL